MKLLLKLLFIIAFTWLISSVIGQNFTQTVRGKVVDRQSGSSIIGANVIIIGTDPLLGAITDAGGNFRITRVPVGRHNLKITYIGYEESNMPELSVGSGKEVVLNIELRESFVQMEEMVIKASRYPISIILPTNGHRHKIPKKQAKACKYHSPQHTKFYRKINVPEAFYEADPMAIRTDEQLGLFPNLSYRIEF
ncbi:MAG: carboxypeptidase-like regulatory domain-containing protein [Cytophagales bacterium]|nr:carboxypeptidase-like regulatory domain-containing protein [Cytophagales bacterium]